LPQPITRNLKPAACLSRHAEARPLGRVDAAGLAFTNRLPSIGPTELADFGGLMVYGVDILEMWRRQGHFVDKILNGPNPGDIPIQRSTKFELILNMKAAKALRITFPHSILPRAKRLIE
jgi:putative ABC transport system substrate-binding protein